MKAKTAVFSPAVVVCILVLAACPVGFARTIRVANDGSADCTTIQAAIDIFGEDRVREGGWRRDPNQEVRLVGEGSRQVGGERGAFRPGDLLRQWIIRVEWVGQDHDPGLRLQEWR